MMQIPEREAIFVAAVMRSLGIDRLELEESSLIMFGFMPGLLGQELSVQRVTGIGSGPKLVYTLHRRGQAGPPSEARAPYQAGEAVVGEPVREIVP